MKAKYLILAAGAWLAYVLIKKQLEVERGLIAAAGDYRLSGKLPTYNDTPQLEWSSRLPIEDDGSRVYI